MTDVITQSDYDELQDELDAIYAELAAANDDLTAIEKILNQRGVYRTQPDQTLADVLLNLVLQPREPDARQLELWGER